MTLQLNRRFFMATGAAALTLPALAPLARAQAAAVVEMLSRDSDGNRNVFSPRLVAIKAGETVLFQATDRNHDSASINGMIPAGAASWDGDLHTDISVTFDQPGVYGYKCSPHLRQGMVGVVLVQGPGMTDNLADADAAGADQGGRAADAFAEIFAEARAAGMLG